MKKQLVYIIFFSLLLASCVPAPLQLLFTVKKDITKDVKVLYNKDSERSLVVLPMSHIGKKGYYESAKNIIDSLRKEGYVFFCEGIGIDPKLDSAQAIMYQKKFRKFLGYNLSFEDNNESLPYYYKSGRYERQDYRNMGIQKGDFQVDLTLNAIVDSFENRYFEVKLTSCDLSTGLNEKYKCDNEYKDINHAPVMTFRNNYIMKRVLESEYKKLVLIYGKKHWMYFYPPLRDNGFELIKGKIF